MPQADDRIVNDIADTIAASGHWDIVTNEYNGYATLVRPRDGFRINVRHVRKQKTLLVEMNIEHLDIYQDRKFRIQERNSTRARPTASDVIGAIERVVFMGQQEYNELLQEIADAERARQEKLAKFEAVVEAFGAKIQGPPEWKNLKDRTPSAHISGRGFDLTIEPSTGSQFRLTGYTNSINADLLIALVPVIRKWQAEQDD